MNIFNEVDKFFSSLKNYISYNEIFLIFISLFLLTVICVIISTSRAYESRLIKAIDMFNNYFIDNPQITDDNLVQFNNKMKSGKVPKLLRKQWQQFVLYREEKASHYMSFDICVAAPIRNSTYKRDITVMNILCYVFVFASILLNLYYSYEYSQGIDLILVLQRVLLCPIIILILNYLITIFLDLRHNAIVSDLYQNYQYFEVNIDKATQTLPDYIDYEVLFDRNEIKRGIPILYAYLQKRAEEEQKELERARLKNVEHEKFNFDEAGVASSLVLERAMQEAENYIAERKKYMQDIERINSDITQEETNFREVTKEYQRQMQVSKETFDNYKTQLEEVSSTIEANYLKKQGQAELDRQRNLEREYDTATDAHKKLLENYQIELTSVENSIKEARQSLEKAMMSEFETYSNKVYDAALQAVEEKEKNKINKLKTDIKGLEETIVAKDKEIDKIYNQNQNLAEQLDEIKTQTTVNVAQPNTTVNAPVQQPSQPEEVNASESVESTEPEPIESEPATVIDNESAQTSEPITFDYLSEPEPEANEEPEAPEQAEEPADEPSAPVAEADTDLDTVDTEENVDSDEQADEEIEQETYDDEDDDLRGEIEDEIINSKDIFTIQDNESGSKKKAGRPKKKKTSEQIKKSVGRPRKETEEEAPAEPKRRGRPRKTEDTVATEQTEPKRRGRPKKEPVEADTTEKEPKKRGRPRKVEDNETGTTTAKKPVGRPKKEVEEESSTEPRRRGRPRKTEDTVSTEQTEPKRRGRPKKETTTNKSEQPKNVNTISTNSEDVQSHDGEITDIDAYLKEIEDEIAKENEKIEQTKKEMNKNARISNKK